MKKLYNGKGKKIHPSPPPSSPYDLLAALPFAILTLAASLSPEEKEVLSYLLSTAGQDKVSGKKNTNLHPPKLGCGCFGCYKSFWARWDASPNRHLIHQILDAVEESVEPLSLSSGRRRRTRPPRRSFDRVKDFKEEGLSAGGEKGSSGEEDGKDEGFEEENGEEEGESVNSASTVRRFVSFIGERVWGVWNQ